MRFDIKTPFIVYCRAVGLYALLTLPAIFLPVMYVISLMYVLTFGWFAWFVFTLLYVLIDRPLFNYAFKILLLFIAVIISVAFAFHMLQVLKVQEDVWNSEEFLLFPFVAVIGGWISVCVSGEKIRSSSDITQKIAE